ncbi:MAG: cell envelope integrity protein TolA [Nitrospirota bacterium]
MPQPYQVNLVSPSESRLKASRIPPSKSDVPVVEEKAAPERATPEKEVPPPKAERVRTVEREPAKPAEDLTKYSEEKIAALRARRESEEYKRDRMSAIRAKEKLARVKRLGEAKSSVEVTARSASGGPATDVPEGFIAGDYANMVSSLIHQEFVFMDPGVDDIFTTISIKVMKNGTLRITKIERPSGHALFDRSAVRAIEKTGRVPPPPYEMELGLRFCPGDTCVE